MVKKILAYLKTHKKKLLIIVAIVIIVFIVKNIIFPNKAKTQYTTAKVERGTIIATVTASGQMLNANTVGINTQASGIVKQIFVKDGDVVTKGQNIMEIDLDAQGQQRNASAWSSYLSAKNSLESAQITSWTLQSDMFTKWKTFYELATSGTYQNSDGTPNEYNRTLAQFLIPQKDWFAAEAKYKNQQQVIAQAQSALNSSWLSYQLSAPIVTAPNDGTITNLVTVQGMIINSALSTSTSNSVQSQQIAVIKNEFKPLATFNLSEIDINKVKIGQKVTLTLDSLTGKTFTGKIMTIDKIGSVTSGVTNYPVIIQFDTNVPQILPNMAVNASIILDTKNDVLSVPNSAIQTANEQNYVRLLKNGQEQQVIVEVGIASDTQTEIISGLKEGDEVITGNASTSQSSTTSSPFSSFGGARGGNVMRLGR